MSFHSLNPSLCNPTQHSLPLRQSQPLAPFLRPTINPNMTAGFVTRPEHGQIATAASQSSSKSVARKWFQHATAPRVYTNAVMVDAIRAEYPQLHLTVVPPISCDLVSWAAAGHAGLAAIDKESDRLRVQNYHPPATRVGGQRGVVAEEVVLGKFLLDWKGKEFVVFIQSGRDGTEPWPADDYQYILSPSVDSTNKLLVEAGVWTSELHDEIWVFDQGYWQKSRALYESIKKASWDDVILDEKMKNNIIRDVDNFFNGHETYDRLSVPWKRGVIYYGPPGKRWHVICFAGNCLTAPGVF